MAFLDHNGESEFPINKIQVFDAMCLAIPTIKGLKVENADKLQGRILVKAGVSLYSWGENIPIQLLEINENKTKVQITSSPKTGIMFGGAFDMGKNRKNIENILSATSNILQRNIATQQTDTTNSQTQQSRTAQNFTSMTTTQMEQPKKKMGFGKKILIGLVILIAIIIIANSGKDKNATSSTNQVESKTNEVAKAKEWKEVFSFKGSGLKKSASFDLTGNNARIKYKYNADIGLFSVYVVPQGEDIMKDGGIPEVMTQKSETSETYITKSAGKYYLNVNSSGGNWSISVEEEK